MLCGNRISRANAKERYRMAPLPRKTSCAAQVALQHCPILHMSKRKSMIPTEFHTVNWLNLLRKPGSKPSGQVAQFAPDRRLRRTGISNSDSFHWTFSCKTEGTGLSVPSHDIGTQSAGFTRIAWVISTLTWLMSIFPSSSVSGISTGARYSSSGSSSRYG